MDAYYFADHYQYAKCAELSPKDERLRKVDRRLGETASAYEITLDRILRRQSSAKSQLVRSEQLVNSWAQSTLKDDLAYVTDRYVKDFDDPAIDDVTAQPSAILLSRLQFVPLTANMWPAWRAATERKPLPPDIANRIQTELAVRGVLFLELVEEYERAGIYFVDAPSDGKSNQVTHRVNPQIGIIRGAITEIDTAITILEVSKQQPNILVVPAPGKFEHGQDGSMNSDLIVFDIDDDKVTGVQVKTQFRQDEPGSYRKDLMVPIDGSYDLGNIRGVKRPGSSEPTPATWPGIVSVHHLASQPNMLRQKNSRPRGSKFRPTPQANNLVRARLTANDLIKRYPKNDPSAISSVSNRLMWQLRRDSVRTDS